MRATTRWRQWLWPRIHFYLGFPGAIGCALTALAGWAIVDMHHWQSALNQLEHQSASNHPSSALVGPVGARQPPAPLPNDNLSNLRTSADLRLLLLTIEQAFVEQGLTWPSAEFQQSVATVTMPAKVEVRANLRGAYPKVRKALDTLLAAVPGLVLRDVQLSRPSADTPELDVRLVFWVLMADASTVTPLEQPK